MIERFHRTLKASLKCKSNTINWSYELPLIMLGLRSIFKGDMQATPAEMFYGKTIRLPSDFFTESKPLSNETEFILNFRQIIKKIKPQPASQHKNKVTYFVQKCCITHPTYSSGTMQFVHLYNVLTMAHSKF